MNDMSDPAPLGHNRPPLVDPEIIEQTKAKVEAFASTAADWLILGQINSAEQAGELADYIAGARQVYKRVDEARATAKKPHDEAAKAVQGMFTPLLDTITRCVEKVKPMQADWLRREQTRLDAEKAEQRRLADAARVAAEEAAAIAAANNSIAGELEAERLQKEAADLERAANRETRANVQSASGGGRTMALRTQKKTRLLGGTEGRNGALNQLYRHYRDRPEVEDLLIRLADAEVRAKGWNGTPPPGTEVYEIDSAA